MYIAMNRFKVRPEEQERFKTRWFDREVYLKTVPGFVSFQLLQGPDREDHVLYASHTIWRSHTDLRPGLSPSNSGRLTQAQAPAARSPWAIRSLKASKCCRRSQRTEIRLRRQSRLTKQLFQVGAVD